MKAPTIFPMTLPNKAFTSSFCTKVRHPPQLLLTCKRRLSPRERQLRISVSNAWALHGDGFSWAKHNQPSPHWTILTVPTWSTSYISIFLYKSDSVHACWRQSNFIFFFIWFLAFTEGFSLFFHVVTGCSFNSDDTQAEPPYLLQLPAQHC